MPVLTYDQISTLPILRQFYFLVWRLFGVNIAILSPDGKLSQDLGATESWSPFCLALRQMYTPRFCIACDQKYLSTAAAQRHSLRYHCWAGLREFMVPIILDGEVLAFIQCGQVMDAPPDQEDWKNTSQLLRGLGFEQFPPEELFFSLRVIHPQTQKDLMTLLELFGNYIAYAQYQIQLSEATQQSRALERALSFIRNHFAEPISLDDIAKVACTSKRNLTRLFQAKTGMTVLDSIQQMRIDKACGQLQAGDMTCMQVAFECGFGSVQQFNRVFHKLKQCTPLTWQKRFQEARQSELPNFGL
jgi:AraC-like DNA-binding protein